MKNRLLATLVAKEKEKREARTRPPLSCYDAPLGRVGEEDGLPTVVVTAKDDEEDRRMRRSGMAERTDAE